MSDRHLFEEVEKALDANDWARVKSLLEKVGSDWDAEARIYKGTILGTCNDIDAYHAGISILRELADGGNGHAAHNLATALCTGAGATDQSRKEYSHYMQIAVDSGFEATIVGDPMWWKKGG